MAEQTVPDVVLHAALDEVYQQPRTLEPNQVADIALRAAAPHIRADERRRIVAKLRDLAVEFPRLSDVSTDLRWAAERIESEEA